jgi:tetratricopeptide (TPR) repeat protein
VALSIFFLLDFPGHVPVLGMLVTVTALAMRADGDRRRAVWPAALVFAMAVVAPVCAWMVLDVVAEEYYVRGSRLVLEGRTELARRAFESAVRFDAQHCAALQGLAELDPDSLRGAALARAAESLRPAWLAPVATRFEIASRLRDLGGMSEACAEASRIDRHGLETRLMRVRILGTAGRGFEAAGALEGVERDWPDNADVWLERARLAEREGRLSEARNALKRIIGSYPGHTVARAWLERLEK